MDCPSCNKLLKCPVVLDCQHYFCRDCIVDGLCPQCHRVTSRELCEDRVLSYIVASLQETVDRCANCDKVEQPMFFCDTCQQPLCIECRGITHNAKIFSKHHIVEIQEYGRVRGETVCNIHACPYILYSLESKVLMCIECFNASSFDHKHNFVNIDLAHKICCDKLEKYAAKLRVFQDDLKEQIDLRQRILSELDGHASEMIKECEAKCKKIIEELKQHKAELVRKITNDKTEKAKTIVDDVKCLTLLQNPIKVNLLSASIFCTYASKIDLLSLYSELHKSMQVFKHTLSQWQQISKVKSTSPIAVDINKSFIDLFISQTDDRRIEENHSLPIYDDIFSGFHHNSVHIDTLSSQNKIEVDEKESNFINDKKFISNKAGDDRNPRLMISDLQCNEYGYLDIWPKYTINDRDQDIYFNELLDEIECPNTELTSGMTSILEVLMNFQRDITARRRFIDANEVSKVFDSCTQLWKRLQSHHRFVQQNIHPRLRQFWQHKIQSIRDQQLIVHERVQGLLSLQRISHRALGTICKLRPFAQQMSTIVNVVRVRNSYLFSNQSLDTLELETTTPMDQVCNQITSLDVDSEKRLLAIEKEAEKRRALQEEEWILYSQQQEMFIARSNLKEVRHIYNVSNRRQYCRSPVVEPNRNREFQGEQVKIHKRGHKGATKLKSSFCFGDKMVSDDSILNLCLENTVGTPDSSSIQSENRSRSSYTADTLQKGCNSVDDSCSNTDVEESNTEFSLMNDTDNLTAVLEFNSQTYASIRIDAANLQSADSYPTQDISENLDENEIASHNPCKSTEKKEMGRRIIASLALNALPQESIQAKEQLLESIRRHVKRIE